MDVYIQSLKQDGYYFTVGMALPVKLILTGSVSRRQADAVKPLLAHEFFHFVQLNYVDSGSDPLWFDEATATYFEEQKPAINFILSPRRINILRRLPLDNDAVNGHARTPLIASITCGFILNAYTIAGVEPAGRMPCLLCRSACLGRDFIKR